MIRPLLTHRAALAVAGLTLLLLCLVPTPLRAEEEPPADEPETNAEEQAEELDAEEARRRAKLLGTAARKRRASEAIALLDEVGFASHEALRKPLLKLMKHASTEVATRSTELLGAQVVEGEKDREKLAKAIWKNAWLDRANKKRYVVQGAALRAVTQLRGAPLAANDAKTVMSMWRSLVGNPNEGHAPALVAVCEYVRLTKDKRFCRLLAEEIDEPNATAPNSPSNPPAAWWEARWKLWKQVYAEAVESLEELTGESFKSTEEAKAWFEANQREFGFRW